MNEWLNERTEPILVACFPGIILSRKYRKQQMKTHLHRKRGDRAQQPTATTAMATATAAAEEQRDTGRLNDRQQQQEFNGDASIFINI